MVVFFKIKVFKQLLDQLDAGHATYFSPSRQATMQLPVKAPDTRVDSFLFFLFRKIRKCTKQVTFSLSFDCFIKLKKIQKYKKVF